MLSKAQSIIFLQLFGYAYPVCILHNQQQYPLANAFGICCLHVQSPQYLSLIKAVSTAQQDKAGSSPDR